MRAYAVGDRVTEAKFGDGTVTASNEYHTVIDFDEHGIRTFSTALVRLTRASSVAPEKPARKTARKRQS